MLDSNPSSPQLNGLRLRVDNDSINYRDVDIARETKQLKQKAFKYRCQQASRACLMDILILFYAFIVYSITDLALFGEIHTRFFLRIGNAFANIDFTSWEKFFNTLGKFHSNHLAFCIIADILLVLILLRALYKHGKTWGNLLKRMLISVYDLVYLIISALFSTEKLNFNDIIIITIPIWLIVIFPLIYVFFVIIGKGFDDFYSNSELLQDMNEMNLKYPVFCIIVLVLVIYSFILVCQKLNNLCGCCTKSWQGIKKCLKFIFGTLIWSKLIQGYFKIPFRAHNVMLLYYFIVIVIHYNDFLKWPRELIIVFIFICLVLFVLLKRRQVMQSRVSLPKVKNKSGINTLSPTDIYSSAQEQADAEADANRRSKDSGYNTNIFVDDVTRLNKTQVQSVFYPRNKQEIKDIINLAKRYNVPISCRGQSHTMGAHTIAKHGFVIDMKYMKRVLAFNGENKEQSDDVQDAKQDYVGDESVVINENENETRKTGEKWIKIQAGATWEHLIQFLNPHGYSPAILQSYCSFSIGGTISVNAHGITSDYALYDSVLSFTLINSQNEELIVTRDNENNELFGLAIGGYGLFGIICDVTLKINENYKLNMESFMLNTYDEFENVYKRYLVDNNVQIKIARINITNYNQIYLYIFKNNETSFPSKTVSNLSERAKSMTNVSRLLYKWIMPIPMIQKFRFWWESQTYQPLDWHGENERNLLLYETGMCCIFFLIFSLWHKKTKPWLADAF